MRAKITRVAAWTVTAGLLGYLFWRTPIDQVAAAARSSASWTFPVLLLCAVTVYLCDSLAMWKTFGWFAARLSFRDVLVVRGASYLLAVINYSLGQGAIVYFVHKVAGVPVLRGAATVLLIMGINVLVLLMLASAGLLLVPESPQMLRVVVAVAYGGLALYTAVLLARPRWLVGRGVFQVLLEAGLGGHLKAMLVRVPHVATLLVFNFVAMRGFDIAVPPTEALLLLPLVYFIAVLPISVQGLGTTQTMMILFFARHAPGDAATREATVLASSLVAQAAGLAFQLTLGLACLRSRAGRTLRRSADPPPVAPPPSAPA